MDQPCLKDVWLQYLKWLMLKFSLIVILLFLMMAYLTIHEYVHYWSASMLGYSSTINWTSLVPYVHIEGDVGLQNVRDLFIIALAPYFVSIILMSLLNVLRARKDSLLRSAILLVMFIDIWWNLVLTVPILFFERTTDFENMLRIGLLGGVVPLFCALLICGLLGFGSYKLVRRAGRTIWDFCKSSFHEFRELFLLKIDVKNG